MEEGQLPRIGVDELRDAARATGKRKAATYDGLHPRHLGLLSNGALFALFVIISASGLAGMSPPPPQLDAVMAPLIPKKDGAFRDIGITPGLVRLRAKARRKYCDEWAIRQGSAIFGVGPSGGAIEAVWTLTVGAEAAVCSDKKAARAAMPMPEEWAVRMRAPISTVIEISEIGPGSAHNRSSVSRRRRTWSDER